MAGEGGWTVKFDGPCSKCGTTLRAGEIAVWDRRLRVMHCVACPGAVEADEVAGEVPLDVGVAGRSARAKHERLVAKRAADVTGRWGHRLGTVVLALTDEPQASRAWAIGARGEEQFEAALRDVAGIRALHDRKVRGTKGNIDHIVIAPAGVFVVDAKKYQGTIEIRNRGWIWKPDWRLTVGGRDVSRLAHDMAWQVEAVTEALVESAIDPLPPITPVLCFIDGEWPFVRPPDEYAGVRLESPNSLKKRLAATSALEPVEIERLTRVLAEAFPPM